MTKDKKYARITASSQGFGKLLALELSRRKINIILVALPGQNIEESAKECRQFGVEARTFEAKPSNRDELLKLTAWVNENFSINILINNAGTGGTKTFHKSDLN